MCKENIICYKACILRREQHFKYLLNRQNETVDINKSDSNNKGADKGSNMILTNRQVA